MTGSATECGPQGHRSGQTPRLDLRALTQADLEQVHALHADAELWTHLPSGRHVDLEQTQVFLAAALQGWSSDELGYWAVRRRLDQDDPAPLLGVAGATRHPGPVWNQYYRYVMRLHPQPPERSGSRSATETLAPIRRRPAPAV